MTSLGVLTGGSYSYARGVNSDGSVIVGYSGSTDGERAFKYVEPELPTITEPSLLTPRALLDEPPVNTPKLDISAYEILYELKKNKELRMIRLSNFNIETFCIYRMQYRRLLDKKKCKFY